MQRPLSYNSSYLNLQPRKGCFEIQDHSGKTYVSLLVSIFSKRRLCLGYTVYLTMSSWMPNISMAIIYHVFCHFVLQNMPRPFKQLRELDIVKIADDMAANMTTAQEDEPSAVAENADNA